MIFFPHVAKSWILGSVFGDIGLQTRKPSDPPLPVSPQEFAPTSHQRSFSPSLQIFILGPSRSVDCIRCQFILQELELVFLFISNISTMERLSSVLLLLPILFYGLAQACQPSALNPDKLGNLYTGRQAQFPFAFASDTANCSQDHEVRLLSPIFSVNHTKPQSSRNLTALHHRTMKM
jgi:hypothetical protein